MFFVAAVVHLFWCYEVCLKNNIRYFFISAQDALLWWNLRSMLCSVIISWWTVTYNERISVVIMKLQIRSASNCIAAITAAIVAIQKLRRNTFPQTNNWKWNVGSSVNADNEKQTMVWKRTDDPTPKKFKTSALAGKVMIVFWDSINIIYEKYHQHGSTINVQTCCETLKNLHRSLKSKHPGLLSRKPLLIHDIARSHSVQITQSWLKSFMSNFFTSGVFYWSCTVGFLPISAPKGQFRKQNILDNCRSCSAYP